MAFRSVGKLGFYESLHCRVRCFSDGYAIGDENVVEGVLTKNRDWFGRRWNNGAREMKNVDFGGLFALRDLRSQAARPSVASND